MSNFQWITHEGAADRVIAIVKGKRIPAWDLRPWKGGIYASEPRTRVQMFGKGYVIDLLSGTIYRIT